MRLSIDVDSYLRRRKTRARLVPQASDSLYMNRLFTSFGTVSCCFSFRVLCLALTQSLSIFLSGPTSYLALMQQAQTNYNERPRVEPSVDWAWQNSVTRARRGKFSQDH